MSEQPGPALKASIAKATSRLEMWAEYLNRREVRTFAEIGVWRGAFAAHILAHCPKIERYYMIDPWRHLDDWNKPANAPDDRFAEIYDTAMAATEFAAEKRIVLRDITSRAMAGIPDASLDAVYIDGDHTLRGILIDLVCSYDKVKTGGTIMGDDFSPSIWQHRQDFEPTLVFPTAVHFAEAKGDPVWGLPFQQFAIVRRARADAFAFRDLAGKYGDRTLLSQFQRGMRMARETEPAKG